MIHRETIHFSSSVIFFPVRTFGWDTHARGDDLPTKQVHRPSAHFTQPSRHFDTLCIYPPEEGENRCGHQVEEREEDV